MCYQEADHVLKVSLSLQIVELDVMKVSGDVGWCVAGCQKGLVSASSC